MRRKAVNLMWMASVLAACLFERSAAAEAAEADLLRDAKFDAYLEAASRHDHFSGTVLVARDGVPVFTRSYGMANYELDVPNSARTVYRIASLTKQFTALAVMQLQEQGKLKVGDPICQYIDQCPAAWKPITLRHLLTHTSGIENYSSLSEWDEVLALRSYKRPELVALFRDLPLRFTPGEQFKYSNSGYVLLGMAIERASGKSYGDYLREKIFTPLGMSQTVYDESRTLLPNRASGYYSLGTRFVNAPYMSPTVSYAAGGIQSTVGDVLLWDQALYSERLLSRKSLDEMFTPVKKGYGYGWQIGEKLGRRSIEHSGSENGFSTYLLRFPAERVTVIVLSNSDRASAGGVGNALAAILFGAPAKQPVAQLRDVLWDVIARDGVEAGMRHYRGLQPAPAGGDAALVYLGYDLIEAGKTADAAAILNFTLGLYPASAYSHDGLADIAAERGDTAGAIAHFERSLALDPKNEYASKGLARLRKPR